jgi:hypothetical protein
MNWTDIIGGLMPGRGGGFVSGFLGVTAGKAWR